MDIDITLSDVQKRLPDSTLIQLTDDPDPVTGELSGEIDESKIIEALEAGYAEAWPYVGVKYSVPIVPTPAALKPHIISVAIKYLYARRAEEMPETRADDYKAAIRFFKDVGAGTATIGIDPAPAAPIAGGAVSNKTTNDRVFTRSKMSGF